MRHTYAIILEISLDGLLPGFWEGISGFEFCAGLDRGNFRYRQELARIEVEQLTDQNRNRSEQVVGRIAHQLFLPKLRQILGKPELDASTAQKIASVHVQQVENAKNPESAHGMAGENPAVSCPSCRAPMVRRSGRDGPFWGCSKFPNCRGMRRISK